MKYKINLTKNKKGSALIYVLLLLLVLSFIGTALLTLSFNANTIALTNKKNSQAHFVALSAVETTINYLDNKMLTQNIMPTYDEITKAIGPPITSDQMTSTTISSNYKVKIVRTGKYTATITATAKYQSEISTVSAKITFILPTQTTVNLENYTAYLKSSTNNEINRTVNIDPNNTTNTLKDANFFNDKLTYVSSDGITINNITQADFDNLTVPEDLPAANNNSLFWNANATDLYLTSGGIYKFNGNINLNSTNIYIGDNDVFLFLNGDFGLAKDVYIRKLTPSSTGTFFIIFIGVGREFDCTNGAGALNQGLATNQMANLFVYGPDVPITRKNKFYYKGAFIAYSYSNQGSQTSYNTAYLKASAIIKGQTFTNLSPWLVLFDIFEDHNIDLVSDSSGSVTNTVWNNNVSEIALD